MDSVFVEASFDSKGFYSYCEGTDGCDGCDCCDSLGGTDFMVDRRLICSISSSLVNRSICYDTTDFSIMHSSCCRLDSSLLKRDSSVQVLRVLYCIVFCLNRLVSLSSYGCSSKVFLYLLIGGTCKLLSRSIRVQIFQRRLVFARPRHLVTFWSSGGPSTSLFPSFQVGAGTQQRGEASFLAWKPAPLAFPPFLAVSTGTWSFASAFLHPRASTFIKVTLKFPLRSSLAWSS